MTPTRSYLRRRVGDGLRWCSNLANLLTTRSTAEKQISSRPRTSPPRRSPGALESASEEGDGDYKDEDGAPSKRLPSFKKKARSAEADDEPRAPNRPSRKKQRSREEDEELPADEEIVLPPEERRFAF